MFVDEFDIRIPGVIVLNNCRLLLLRDRHGDVKIRIPHWREIDEIIWRRSLIIARCCRGGSGSLVYGIFEYNIINWRQIIVLPIDAGRRWLQIERWFARPRRDRGPNHGFFRARPSLCACNFLDRLSANIICWFRAGAILQVDTDIASRDHVVVGDVGNYSADVVSYGSGHAGFLGD